MNKNWTAREAAYAVRAYQQAVTNDHKEEALMHRRHRARTAVGRFQNRAHLKAMNTARHALRMIEAIQNYKARRTHRLGEMPNGKIVLLQIRK